MQTQKTLTLDDALAIVENIDRALLVLRQAQRRGKTPVDIYYVSVLSALRRDLLKHAYFGRGG